MPKEIESDMNILHQSAFGIDPNLDPAWCNWFVGWVDGEGCFNAYIDKRNMGITPMLQVKVRYDDVQLVNMARDTLRCGNISIRRSIGKNDQIQWRCEDFVSCRHIIVPLFDQYPLRSKKNRDYQIWREITMLVSEEHHLNGNRAYVLDLCQQLKDIKKYIPPTGVEL